MVDGWYAERESRNVGTGPAGGRTSDLYYYSDTGTRFRSRCRAHPDPNPNPNPNPDPNPNRNRNRNPNPNPNPNPNRNQVSTAHAGDGPPPAVGVWVPAVVGPVLGLAPVAPADPLFSQSPSPPREGPDPRPAAGS